MIVRIELDGLGEQSDGGIVIFCLEGFVTLILQCVCHLGGGSSGGGSSSLSNEMGDDEDDDDDDDEERVSGLAGREDSRIFASDDYHKRDV